MKKSVIIHEDTTALFENIGTLEAGMLVKAMIDYQNGREVVLDNPILLAIFEMLKVKLDKDNADYEAKCQRNAENARKRWDASESECMRSDAVACDGMRMDAQKDKQKDKQKDIKRESKRFAPPSPEDVRAYCEEKGYKVDAEAFVDFYAAKGWKVGNQPMKDWKAAVRTWTRRESSAPPGKVRQYRNRYNDFPQRNNDYDQIQDDWIRASFGK